MSDRNLLILDLDETLIYSEDDAGNSLGAVDFRVGPFAVYRRPHLGEFLESVESWYDLAVWSSAGRAYVEAIVRQVFRDPALLRFVWSAERCTRRFHPETQDTYWVKDLKKVKRAGFSLNRVLKVDDTPSKLERNYGNHLHVRPFEGSMADTELRDLLPFLECLRSVENLRAVEKREWRQQASR